MGRGGVRRAPRRRRRSCRRLRRCEGVTQMDDETLELIQTKIAFLERAASELSDVVFRQHNEIRAIEAKLKAVSDRLDGAPSDEGSRPLEQEIPPHY